MEPGSSREEKNWLRNYLVIVVRPILFVLRFLAGLAIR
jgi:hypothetical protein